MSMLARLGLLAAVISTATVACSTAPAEETENGEAEISTEDASRVFQQLAFLQGASSVTEISGGEKTTALAALDGVAPDGNALEQWAGVPTVSETATRIELSNGRSATMASRRWSDSPSFEQNAAHVVASVTRVTGPDGQSFAYAERLALGATIRAELFRVEHKQLVPVLRQTSSLTAGLEAQSEAIRMAALGPFEGQVAPQALSKPWRSRLCTTCTMTLQAAKIVGPAVLAIAGTGGASAVCTRLGITAAVTTAATGPGALISGGGTWVACNVAFYAIGAVISSAMLIDGEQSRLDKCSGVGDSIGLGKICEGLAPDTCSVAGIARATTPAGKCSLMGKCARDFNCRFAGPQLCPSLDVSGQTKPMCEEIMAQTCAPPIGLVDADDFDAPCAFLATKHASSATPSTPSTP